MFKKIFFIIIFLIFTTTLVYAQKCKMIDKNGKTYNYIDLKKEGIILCYNKGIIFGAKTNNLNFAPMELKITKKTISKYNLKQLFEKNQNLMILVK